MNRSLLTLSYICINLPSLLSKLTTGGAVVVFGGLGSSSLQPGLFCSISWRYWCSARLSLICLLGKLSLEDNTQRYSEAVWSSKREKVHRGMSTILTLRMLPQKYESYVSITMYLLSSVDADSQFVFSYFTMSFVIRAPKINRSSLPVSGGLQEYNTAKL